MLRVPFLIHQAQKIPKRKNCLTLHKAISAAVITLSIETTEYSVIFLKKNNFESVCNVGETCTLN